MATVAASTPRLVPVGAQLHALCSSVLVLQWSVRAAAERLLVFKLGPRARQIDRAASFHMGSYNWSVGSPPGVGGGGGGGSIRQVHRPRHPPLTVLGWCTYGNQGGAKCAEWVRCAAVLFLVAANVVVPADLAVWSRCSGRPAVHIQRLASRLGQQKGDA